jgi:hypothetical protein
MGRQLLLVGSIANLIVVGVPVTLMTLAVVWAWLHRV